MIRDSHKISRQKSVLKIIVRLYTGTARPVSSQVVARALNLSSATIRHVMAELEDLGLIMHPHTSAGRIPTNAGYRLYVDSLMELKKMAEDLTERIEFEANKTADLEDFIVNTVEVLTKITNCAAFALIPSFDKNLFKRIQLVPISDDKLLVVLITSLNSVKTFTVTLDNSVSEGDLHRISNFLNEKLDSMNLNKMMVHLKQLLDEQKNSLYSVVKDAFSIMNQAVLHGYDDRVFLNGTKQLLALPEFREVERIHELMHFLDEKERLLDIINADIKSSDNINIHIGEDAIDCRGGHFSIITAHYNVSGNVSGAMGIIGPTRMEYESIVPTLQSLTEIIAKSLRSGI